MKFRLETLSSLTETPYIISMRRPGPVLMIILTFVSLLAFAQSGYEAEGRILHAQTGEPLIYANIFNLSSGKGTISNTEGYFRIAILHPEDSIRISYIGFQEVYISFHDRSSFYTVELLPGAQLLDEVTIEAQDYSYLYAMVEACRKMTPGQRNAATSKAFYELKSFQGTRQVELVEGYYNLESEGYEPKRLDLKAGRIAIQPYGDRFFVSLESSRALMMFHLMRENDHFPQHPLALSAGNLKRKFYLTPETQYLDHDSDSVFVIRYTPKDTTGSSFRGFIWLNKTKNFFEKITLQCNDVKTHPFLPIFPGDSISAVDLNITKTFRQYNGSVVFGHADFIYEMHYKSRTGKEEAQEYDIQTRAVLYAYDHEHPFVLPVFDFEHADIADYRKINAMPYNDFLWENHDEYRLGHDREVNDRFFSDSLSFTNKTLFSASAGLRRGLMQHPYRQWSEKRVLFREVTPDSSVISQPMRLRTDQYHLAVRMYMDINTYKDSTHILTAAVFDPYASFYHLPIDQRTHCFINIYFDLCEIERRRLEELLRHAAGNQVQDIFRTCEKERETRLEHYLRAVERGTDERELKKYNAIVKKELGLDNMALFLPEMEDKAGEE